MKMQPIIMETIKVVGNYVCWISVFIIASISGSLGQDFGYSYSYSCFKDCGYYKTQEFTFCQKYQRDYCWVPSRRSLMIVLLIIIAIASIVGIVYCMRYCKKKQAKARPLSPPPGSMCIWQA